MPLGDAGAPEGRGGAVGQDGLTEDPEHGEQAGVPAGGDEGEVAGLLRGGIDGGEVVGDLGMGVVGVDRVEEGDRRRALLGQVRRGAAAVEADIDFVRPVRHVVHVRHRRALRRDRARITPGEDDDELHVVVLGDRLLRAPPEVAVSVDCDPDHEFSCRCCFAA